MLSHPRYRPPTPLVVDSEGTSTTPLKLIRAGKPSVPIKIPFDFNLLKRENLVSPLKFPLILTRVKRENLVSPLKSPLILTRVKRENLVSPLKFPLI